MSNEEPLEDVDRVLDLLTNPLSRYILFVLAGIDPGSYKGPIEVQKDDFTDDEQ